MAKFFSNQKLLEGCKQMHESKIICLLQTVGQIHRATAEAYLEFATFHDERMQMKDESIIHYEKAQLIFETLYGLKSLECTEVAIRLSEVYSACGKSKDSLYQVEVALNYYSGRIFSNY